MPILKYIQKDNVRTPILYGSFTVFLAFFISYADRNLWSEYLPFILLSQVDIGRNILTAIATSLLTMSTITFSVMTMAMNTYTTQYSPRTVPNIYTDLVTIRAKSFFLAGFLYAILSLLLMKHHSEEHMIFAPAIAVLMAAFIVCYFMYFIQYVSKMTQVNNLLVRLSESGQQTIGCFNKDQIVHKSKSWPLEEHQAEIIVAPNVGYTQSVNVEKLINEAIEHELTIELIPMIGEYVMSGAPHIRVWGLNKLNAEQCDSVKSMLNQYISVGKNRSDQGDIEYTIQKITEIALRACSPSTNDPNTTIYCVRELGRLLLQYGNGNYGQLLYLDEGSKVRFVLSTLSFDRLLYKTFYQLIHYSRQDVSIMSEILEALGYVAKYSNEIIKQQVGAFGHHIIASMDQQVLIQYDKHYWQERVQFLQEQTGENYV